MQAHLLTAAAKATVQSQVASTGTGAGAGSTAVAITPGTYGSMIVGMEGQGSEIDILAATSSATFFPAYSTFISVNSGGADRYAHARMGWLPLMLPIAATMDGNALTWKVQAWSSYSNYAGFVNARIAELPLWWDSNTP
jgi:hypothetical protein